MGVYQVKSLIHTFFCSSPSRLPQVSHDGFHFGPEERVSAWLVMQGMEFFHQQRAGIDPAVKGFHCALLGGMRGIEHGQFGLVIRADCKHF